MPTSKSKKSLLKKFIALILGFGPGIFAIGYTIGTGSVTSMNAAESKFGMQLLCCFILFVSYFIQRDIGTFGIFLIKF